MSMAVGVGSTLVPPKTHFRPKSYNSETNPLPLFLQFPRKLHSQLPFTTSFSSFHRSTKSRPSNLAKASVGNIEYEVEPQTSVKFEKDLAVPGCSSSLTLVGTGYREKVFAIIGVKVYAAGFYVNLLLNEKLFSWKGRPQAELLGDSSLFKSILQEPMEKSLKISLVRDVDGDTFWNALNDVISPRIKEPTACDQSALSTFRSTFQGRPLKKGTVIILTWSEPSKMLVSISSNGIPSAVDAIVESTNVTTSLFDAFFGESPVSPTLKESVTNGLVAVLNRT